jgi:hypothetical protein
MDRMQLTAREAPGGPGPDDTRADPKRRDELSVVIAGQQQAGSGVAELWCGSALLGILHELQDGIVLRLESQARGPLKVRAIALERALAEARELLGVTPAATPAGS